MAGEIIKDARLNVRMTSDIMSRLQAIAKDMGISVSALGAVAIAEYVQSKERQNSIVQQQVKATTKVIQESLNPETMMAMASAMFGKDLQTEIAGMIEDSDDEAVSG